MLSCKLREENLIAQIVCAWISIFWRIYNYKSPTWGFCNFDGSRTRTINIKLKKDRRKGLFGRATLGAGSSDRYTGNVSANMFNEATQMSFLGAANNVNRQRFFMVTFMVNLNKFGGRGAAPPQRGGGVATGGNQQRTTPGTRPAGGGGGTRRVGT